MTDNDTPRIGGDRNAPATVSIDVSGTVGPDALGQEIATVEGHRADVPGVREDVPSDSPRADRQDTGEELPVLLSSSISYDPVEGATGEWTQIEHGTCDRCGYDRIKVHYHTHGIDTTRTCQACGAKSHEGGQFERPPMDRERISRLRDTVDPVYTTDRYSVFEVAGSDSIYRLVDTQTMTLETVSADRIHHLFRIGLEIGALEPPSALARAWRVADEDGDPFESLDARDRVVLGLTVLPDDTIDLLLEATDDDE